MPEPTVYKGIYGESSKKQQVSWSMTLVVMQLLSVVVALAVVPDGLKI
ncbi:MAG: hypothetical protein JSW38_08525 [Dehalococcoidia bacterium]|nr:MAG: hypothetical protein JSW38_08525 [Dehalococcoidia bacterium]